MIRETLNLKVSEVLTPYILCGFAEKHPLPTFILVFDHKNIIVMIKAESDAACGLYSLCLIETHLHTLSILPLSPPHQPPTSRTHTPLQSPSSTPAFQSFALSLHRSPPLQVLIQCTNHQLDKSMVQPITITSN